MHQRRRPAPRRPRRAARWGGIPIRRTRTHVGSYRVHAVELGDGDECIVLLHGLCGSSMWWRRAAPALARHYRVAIPDMIGFGRSRCPGRPPSIADLARHLREWFALCGLTRPHLVGHSMGGEIAIHLAAAASEALRSLILVDSAGLPRPLSPRRMLRFATELIPPRRWGDPLFLPIIAGDALTAGPRVTVRAIGQILRDDVRPLLPRIRVPTLVVWGEHDPVVPLTDAEALRDGIAGARLAVIPGAAHNPMVDRPEDFIDAVLPFLRGMRGEE